MATSMKDLLGNAETGTYIDRSETGITPNAYQGPYGQDQVPANQYATNTPNAFSPQTIRQLTAQAIEGANIARRNQGAAMVGQNAASGASGPNLAALLSGRDSLAAGTQGARAALEARLRGKELGASNYWQGQNLTAQNYQQMRGRDQQNFWNGMNLGASNYWTGQGMNQDLILSLLGMQMQEQMANKRYEAANGGSAGGGASGGGGVGRGWLMPNQYTR